jgi:hypothetical protein
MFSVFHVCLFFKFESALWVVQCLSSKQLEIAMLGTVCE